MKFGSCLFFEGELDSTESITADSLSASGERGSDAMRVCAALCLIQRRQVTPLLVGCILIFCSSALGNSAQGGKTAGAFASGIGTPLHSRPGTDLKEVGKSFLEKDYAMCGQDCLYHKATSNITYQMDWVQRTIDELKRIQSSRSLKKTQEMNELTNGFCKKLGLEVYKITHPSFSLPTLNADQCLKTYVTFMENWLWKARASLAENEAQIRALRCDSGSQKSSDRARCEQLMTADLEELYQLSSSARLTQVPEFMTAKEIHEFHNKYSNKGSLAKLYEVSGDEFESMSAIDYVKQKLVLSENDCNVLKQSAKQFKETEGSDVDRPDQSIFEACKNSKQNLESLLNTQAGSSSSSSGMKLKELVESGRQRMSEEFKEDLDEQKRSALRSLYDDHHDESVISVRGAYDSKAKKSWIKVTRVPEDSSGAGGPTAPGKQKSEIEIQEIDIAKARKDTGSRAGEFKASPPVFIEAGGKRKRGESAVIQRTMQSGQVELDDQKQVKPVNDNRLIHKLDQVSGDE